MENVNGATPEPLDNEANEDQTCIDEKIPFAFTKCTNVQKREL